MSKAMTMFALVAGGAATYAWIRKSGGTDQVESQVESAVGKVRSTLGNGDAIKDAATEMRHKANELTSDVAERTEDAMADRAP